MYSDNSDEGTVTVFSADDLPSYDAEFTMFNTVPAAEVVRMDRDRNIAFAEGDLTLGNPKTN